MKAGAVCVVHLAPPLPAPAACCLLLLVAAACCCLLPLLAAACCCCLLLLLDATCCCCFCCCCPSYRSLLLAMGKGGEGLHNDCWGTVQYTRCHSSEAYWSSDALQQLKVRVFLKKMLEKCKANCKVTEKQLQPHTPAPHRAV